jgi:Ankyrin repeats (3 copies)
VLIVGDWFGRQRQAGLAIHIFFKPVHASIIIMPSSRVSIQAQFVQSAHDGDIDGIKHLFQDYGEHLVLATRNAALMAATEMGHLNVVQCLVEMLGANAEAMDAQGVTPLLLAQQYGRHEVASYLKSVIGGHVRVVQQASPAIASHAVSPSSTRNRFDTQPRREICPLSKTYFRGLVAIL